MHNNKIYTFHFTNVIFEREKKKKKFLVISEIKIR